MNIDKKFDLIIVGGGPAGLMAAVAAKKDKADVVVIENIARDDRVQYKNELLQEGIGKILTLPLNLRQKNIAELTLFSKGEERQFGEDEVSFVKAIAQQCACAIENARMYQRVKYEYQQLMEDFGYDSSGN